MLGREQSPAGSLPVTAAAAAAAAAAARGRREPWAVPGGIRPRLVSDPA